MKTTMTITDIKREYPNVVPPAIVAKYLKKDPQRFRNMAKAGRYPFVTVEPGRNRDNYTIPTKRFVAWLAGRLD